MFRTRLSRALLIPAVLVPLSVGTLAFASSASALKPATSAVKCSTLTGTIGATGSLSGCTGTGSTGGGGTFPTTGANPSTISWTNGQTTSTTFNYASGSGTLCGRHSTEEIASGTVQSSSTPTIPVGQKFKADICVNTKKDTLSLYPGTKFKI
ncbi:MAG: hypothetical protein WAM97_07135 [Acidimicrobiales bacterium]